MSLHQAASISNWDPEAPEKSSEFRPLSACGHPPGRTAPADDRRHESSHDGQWQPVWLRALRLCACTLPNTSTRRRAGRIRTPAPTEPGGRPRPGWRPASPRAGAHGLSSGVAGDATVDRFIFPRYFLCPLGRPTWRSGRGCRRRTVWHAGERSDLPPQRRVGCQHPVVTMAMPARRRNQRRPLRLGAAARADP